MNLTLFLYLARNYINSIWITLGAISSLFIVANFIDLLKKSATKSIQSLGFIKIVQLVFSKLPYLIHESFPYAMFIAAIIAFQKLSRKNEYTILKASGLSLWQFLIPFLTIGIIFGTVLVTIFNPISTSLLNYYRKEHAKLIEQNSMSFSLFNNGVWFVDKNLDSNYKRLVNAEFLNVEKMEFTDVTFLIFNQNFNLITRISAGKAILSNEEWHLTNVRIYNARGPFEFLKKYQLDTALKENDIKSSLIEPEVVSVWELPYLISNLNQAGYSSIKHLSYLYKVLSRPIFICGLILLASSFALQSGRNIKTSRLILCGSILGFATFFLGELTAFLGNNGQLPPILAISLAGITVTVIGVAAIYHTEEI